MQATRVHEDEAALSGTFETTSSLAGDRVEEAHRLALEIERLLSPTGDPQPESYDVRITRALARSLTDALSDMKRGPRRAKTI